MNVLESTVCLYCGGDAEISGGVVTCVDKDGCGAVMSIECNLEAYEKVVEEYGNDEAKQRLEIKRKERV